MTANRASLFTLVASALASINFNAPLYADIQTTPPVATTNETIVIIRHGEKPPHGLGQLSVVGLNRSLALPDVLIGKFGKPDYIFAPDPSEQLDRNSNGDVYSYVRPLATIEPTAIKLGMPVSTQIGFTHIQDLQNELLKPIYANSVIFVAWEHILEDQFTKNVVTSFGGNASAVPSWPDNDFDTIFVIRIQRTSATTTETFTIDHEGLNGKLSANYPVLPSN